MNGSRSRVPYVACLVVALVAVVTIALASLAHAFANIQVVA
jgi:hypothetical protein